MKFLFSLKVSMFLFDFFFLSGPHLSFSGKVVPVVLESLVSGPQVALPPVNWASVLGPIMRANFGNNFMASVFFFANRSFMS